MLKFKGSWRFTPPKDGDFYNQNIPTVAVDEFANMIMKLSNQGNRQEIIEHFKGYFCNAVGKTDVWSSSEGWAETDLFDYMAQASSNAPLFIEAIYDAGTEFLVNNSEFVTVDVELINQLIEKHNIGYEIIPPNLVVRKGNLTLVEVVKCPSTLTENAIELYQKSLQRSEELIAEGKEIY